MGYVSFAKQRHFVLMLTNNFDYYRFLMLSLSDFVIGKVHDTIIQRDQTS